MDCKRVQQRNHESFRFRVIGGNISIDESESQAEDVGHRNASEREQGILWQCSGMELNFSLSIDGANPVAAKREQAIEDCQPRKDDG